jgi:hypothetical protein
MRAISDEKSASVQFESRSHDPQARAIDEVNFEQMPTPSIAIWVATLNRKVRS